MKHWQYVTILILWTIITIALAQNSSTPGRVDVSFVGGTNLDKLARGETGSGTLLYYLVERGVERPSLVVRLTKQAGAQYALAEVFDVPSGNDHVPVQLDGRDARLDGRQIPAITIKALGGWWVRDGLINYNLDVQANGPVYAMWGGGYDPKSGPQRWTGLVKPGEPAVKIQVRDPESSGLPKWDLRLLVPSFEGQGFYRTNYAERKCNTPVERERSVSPLWPFVAETGAYEQPNRKFRPPIVVDWARGRVTHFSELVTVRNQNCSYSLYSISRLEGGKVNEANFETPFAFYDLSGEGMGSPNLILRTERFAAEDPWSVGLDPQVQQGRLAPSDFETVRYSWRNSVGDLGWDYKIEVMGLYPYTSKTSIAGGNLTISAPSYDDFPPWVISRSWPVVTFIDTEGTSYSSTEGIYEWSPREIGVGYIFGWNSASKPQAFAEIRKGLRGEYRYRRDLPPKLYLSPIDNRLHLLGAEGGLWNLGNGFIFRAQNLGGSLHINTWTRERAATSIKAGVSTAQSQKLGGIEEALYALAGYLIYSGPDGVELRQADFNTSLFEIPPPTNQASWRTFREQLAPYTKRDPNKLQSWVSAFPGKSFRLAGARISNMRAIPGGFRFALDVRSGLQAQGDDTLGLGSLKPGSYSVTYDGKTNIETLTPPILSATLHSGQLRQLEKNALQVKLRNDGLTDLPSATLELWATSSTGQDTIAVSQTVSLLAQTPITTTLPWAPLSAGRWKLTPKIRQPDDRLLALQSAQVTVLPANATSPSILLAAGGTVTALPFIILGLASLGILALFAFQQQWHTLPEPPVDDTA